MPPSRRALTLVLLLFAAAAPRAQERAETEGTHESGPGGFVPEPTVPAELGKPEKQPFPISLIIQPLKSGMLIRLPIIDTDPNRGITFGVLPVWIINSERQNRIISMHAPSLTYNPTFKTNFTYRYYYYPTKDSALMWRAALSQVLEKEAFLQYDNSNLFDEFGEWGVKTQYNIDASNRFFGFGPATTKGGQSNYVQKTLLLNSYFGLPIYKGSKWYWTAEQRLQGTRIDSGPVHTIPGAAQLYPDATPQHWHQSATCRGYITYDSLDNSVTTTKGTYAEFFAETSQRALGSEYTFQHYSVDLKHFQRMTEDDTFVTAARVKFEQIVGNGVPLWLQPYLGGKYMFPAFGDGRFTDLGALASILEERITVFRLKTAGVTMKYELAPFTGLGTVFDTPGDMKRRYVQPLFGLGLRAVAPPQIVGSIDFGVGREGLSAFMDINYPF